MTKTRVAILGGGLSGLVTAFNLSAPEQNQQYDITIYQLGWRLGGKCATGRNPDLHQRIQEHGLHVFMGQYDNAFSMVQALYAEAANPPFPDWRAGYTQVPAMSLMEEVDGQWIPWVIELPVFPGTRGSIRRPACSHGCSSSSPGSLASLKGRTPRISGPARARTRAGGSA